MKSKLPMIFLFRRQPDRGKKIKKMSNLESNNKGQESAKNSPEQFLLLLGVGILKDLFGKKDPKQDKQPQFEHESHDWIPGFDDADRAAAENAGGPLSLQPEIQRVQDLHQRVAAWQQQQQNQSSKSKNAGQENDQPESWPAPTPIPIFQFLQPAPQPEPDSEILHKPPRAKIVENPPAAKQSPQPEFDWGAWDGISRVPKVGNAQPAAVSQNNGTHEQEVIWLHTMNQASQAIATAERQTNNFHGWEFDNWRDVFGHTLTQEVFNVAVEQAEKYGVDPAHAIMLFSIESDFQSSAKNDENGGHGAFGLGQMRRLAIQDVLELRGVRRPRSRQLAINMCKAANAAREEGRDHKLFDLEFNAGISMQYFSKMQKHMKQLLHREPTFTEIYFAYHQGPTEATTVVKSGRLQNEIKGGWAKFARKTNKAQRKANIAQS